MKQSSPRFNFFSLLLVLMPKKVKEHWWIVNKIALCPWLIWSDSNATHLLLCISTTCAITHHSSPMCNYSLLVPAVQYMHMHMHPICLFFANQMFKSKCKKDMHPLRLVSGNQMFKSKWEKICIQSDLSLQIKYSNPNAKNANVSNLTCVCGSNVQIQMQKNMHPLRLVSADQMFKTKWKKIYASNLT